MRAVESVFSRHFAECRFFLHRFNPNHQHQGLSCSPIRGDNLPRSKYLSVVQSFLSSICPKIQDKSDKELAFPEEEFYFPIFLFLVHSYSLSDKELYFTTIYLRRFCIEISSLSSRA